MLPPIQAILVPQGAEYQAVCRALRPLPLPKPVVMALPLGGPAVSQWLHRQAVPTGALLVMGLCGSLTPAQRLGEAVLYAQCRSMTARLLCDRALTQALHAYLQVPIVDAFTSDRVVHLAAAKQRLAQTHAAAVVDMEGYAVLQGLPQRQIAMLRVVSDDCTHDLPDLSRAVSPDGHLRAGAMAIALLQRPVAAARLVRGAATALGALQRLAAQVSLPAVG